MCVSVGQVDRVRAKQVAHVSQLEEKIIHSDNSLQELKVELAQQRHVTEEAKAESTREASDNRQAQKELAQMRAQRDEATSGLGAAQRELDTLKEERSTINHQLREARATIRELTSTQSNAKQQHQAVLRDLKDTVNSRVEEIVREYRGKIPKPDQATSMGWLPPPPPALLFHEQQADLTAMMLNNELVMIEEHLLGECFANDPAAGTIPLWLQQMHMLKRTLCSLDPQQLGLLEASLDAQEFDTVLQQDVGLALAHAQQRATALAGQLIHAHKLSCVYFEECVRCKSSEVNKIQCVLDEEKEARKGIVDELSQQHETIATLMEIGPEWFSDGTPSIGAPDQLQRALDQANADKALYQAALEQAEEQLLRLASGKSGSAPSDPLLAHAKSIRDGLSALSIGILKDTSHLEELEHADPGQQDEGQEWNPELWFESQ